ncbi:MAG TPA: PadR family transcriptional regulator [Aliidongia sp.]|nr:PadR family transcriptional regulator [Aliidongia sp.]
MRFFGRHGGMGRRFMRDEQSPDGRGRRHREGLGHRNHGRRSHLGRFLEHGDLRLVVLKLIADTPRHGYDIIKAIEDLAGGAYTPSPGVVYPTLTLLEELGHITVSTGDGPRKLHTITEDGTRFLEANAPSVSAIFARFAEAGPSAGPAPQILRSMENLKLALRLRLARDRVDESQIRAIAAAIDAAATAVEQT